MKKISIINSGVFVYTSEDGTDELEVYLADTSDFNPTIDQIFGNPTTEQILGKKVDIVNDDDFNEVMDRLNALKANVEDNAMLFKLYNAFNGVIERYLSDSKLIFNAEDITKLMNEIEEYHYKKLYENNKSYFYYDTDNTEYNDDDDDLVSEEVNAELEKLAEDYLYVRYNEMDAVKEQLPKEYKITKELLVDFGKYIYNL